MASEETSYTLVTVLAVLGVIVACILLFFGILLVLAATAPGAESGWMGAGLFLLVAGLALVALSIGGLVYLRTLKAKAQPQTIIQKIDLSGDIEMEKLKCRECGAELSQDSITVKEGAIFVSCPYCGSHYQMVEEPKW